MDGNRVDKVLVTTLANRAANSPESDEKQ
jgi:hypothetical protein